MAFIRGGSSGGGGQEGVLPVNPTSTEDINVWIETDDPTETESALLTEIETGD